ncbi:cAMP-binding domain of CRP or a regulatory subunit of cAMP-dependent protein kinases [Dyadobacter soli]|uniref:cAMP-binding domain of CRP or a regulatory subunit of cAMP-dependent protein kinases n=1 Tax=Dyadobacter soli TaxID=659014 RepID=A0A1G7VLY5_9BACT|nr:Crp/Fnr family transcriptional regulator [Dyadobacter soli]SDG59910.1 cAMP-binding domain of CRP or a regulatory subunit of cAMP-dependent protein kinases [Dyadobacter soli]
MSNKLRQHIEEIVPLTDQEFQYVLSHFSFRKFKKRQYLIQQGDYVRNDFFILSGLVKSCSTDQIGKSHVVFIASENWWVSDPEAYHNQTPATVDIDCVEETETGYISLENREKLCRELRKLEYFFLRKTTAGYIASQKRILMLISANARERYQFMLLQYPGLLQRVPKSVIASYLGVTRETLSRLST